MQILIIFLRYGRVQISCGLSFQQSSAAVDCGARKARELDKELPWIASGAQALFDTLGLQYLRQCGTVSF